MTTLQTVLITGTCLLLLLSLMAVLALPGLRLRQVGRFLRESLEDPTREKEWPRALNPIGAELSALRDRLIQQQEEVRQQEHAADLGDGVSGAFVERARFGPGAAGQIYRHRAG